MEELPKQNFEYSDETNDAVDKILMYITKKWRNAFTDEASFTRDLGFDKEIDIPSLILLSEAQFGIKIYEDLLEKVSTVGDFKILIEECLLEKKKEEEKAVPAAGTRAKHLATINKSEEIYRAEVLKKIWKCDLDADFSFGPVRKFG